MHVYMSQRRTRVHYHVIMHDLYMTFIYQLYYSYLLPLKIHCYSKIMTVPCKVVPLVNINATFFVSNNL